MAQNEQQQQFERYVGEGHDHAWAGKWRAAATAYRRALEIQPDAMVYIDLGLALYETGEITPALEAYRRALELSPDEPAALQKIAEIHARRGEPIKAAASYLALADSYMRARDPAQAVAAWQQVVRYDPTSRVAYRRLAEAYRRGRRDDLAAQATLALARVHAGAGESQSAIRAAREALRLQPDLDGAQRLLASLGAADARAAESESAAPSGDGGEFARRRALERLAESLFDEESGDLSVEAVKARAIDLQSRGQVEEAAQLYQEVIEAGGGSSAVHYTLGTLYQTMLRYDDAIREFTRIARDPEYVMAAHYSIGQCYQSQGSEAQALYHYQIALDETDLEQVDRRHAEELIHLFEALTDAYESRGDVDRARELSGQLAELLGRRGWDLELRSLRARHEGLAPDVGGAPVGSPEGGQITRAIESATYYREQGAISAAIDELFWAMPLGSDYLPLHVLLAELFVDAQQPADALAKLATVAEVHIARGQPHQAIQLFERALEISPTETKVRGKLIDLLVAHGRVDEAIAHSLELAESFYQLAQGERAIEKLHEALRLAPRGKPDSRWESRIYERLTDIYVQRLDWRRAAAACEGLVRLRPDEPELLIRLADLYYTIGAEERALETMARVAELVLERQGAAAMIRVLREQCEARPESEGLLRLLGEMQGSIGDIEGAAASWERAVELLVRRGERSRAAALLRQIVGLQSRHEARYRAMLNHLMNR